MSKTDIKSKLTHSIKALLTVKEAADLIGIHPMTLRQYIWRGKIPFIQPKNKIFILPKDLADFLNAHKKRHSRGKLTEIV